MRTRRGQRFPIKLLTAAFIVVGCSRLTDIDWTLVKADGSSGGTSSGGAPDGGQPFVGGEAGEAGEPGGGAPAGGAPDTAEPFGGTATSGGSGGSGTSGGSGGAGGLAGGSGGAANAGTGGGGSGGSGSTMPSVCVPAKTAPVASSLVLFAGPAQPTGARGGRTGLDADCEQARVKLALPQTKSHAFITIAPDDYIANWGALNGQFLDVPTLIPVVGPTGLEIAKSLPDLIHGAIENSVNCAKVVPADTIYWLSGSGATGLMDPNSVINYNYGQFAGLLDDCNGWTSGLHDPLVRARPGSTLFADPRLLCAASTATQITFLYVQCDSTSTMPLLCLAYTP